MSALAEEPPKVIAAPQLVVLDYDRTLGDAEAAMERLYAVIADKQYGVGAMLISQAREEAEKQGKPFAPLALMKKQLEWQETDADEFGQEYIAHDEKPLLYPDAELFLEMLEVKQIPSVVMSYAEDLLWQKLKIRASGISGPLILLEHTAKGEEIAKFRTGNTYVYQTPGFQYETDSVCLIDDKAEAFQGLPADCTGIWLQRSEELLPSQKGNVPVNVAVVSGLDELTIKDGKVKPTAEDKKG